MGRRRMGSRSRCCLRCKKIGKNKSKSCLMYKPIVSLLICCSLFACSNKKKEPVKEETTENNYLMLRSDTVNVVKTTDTLLVSESTCRGCAYETSTEFGVTDSMDIVKIEHVY